jgi:hypothetical protein
MRTTPFRPLQRPCSLSGHRFSGGAAIATARALGRIFRTARFNGLLFFGFSPRSSRLAAAILLLPCLLLLAQSPLPQPASTSLRFATIDLFLDSGQSPLAAWQLEFTGKVDNGKVSLVGIEGGEPQAYSKPAYYDPAALAGENGRVILAAFSTAKADTLPTGKSRIARLHVAIKGNENAQPQYTLTIRIAADADGHPIQNAAATAAQGDDR